MPALAALTRATAIASGEWSRDGEHCQWIAWAKDPDATERPAWYYSHGGAETNWEDLELGTNASYLMLVNELNVVLISYDVSPGWFQLEGGEGTSSRDVFEKQLEHAAFIAWARTQMGFSGNTILPSGMWITTDPDFSGHGGTSSGGYDVLRCQMMPSGTLANAREKVIRGERRFAAAHGHECNFLLVSIAQVSLSQFCEYVTDDDLLEVDSTYLTNGSTTAGASTIAVDGDTPPMYRANRILVTVSAVDYTYALTADFAGGAGTISVEPTIQATIADNTPVVFQHPTGEAYGELSWAQQYLFSSAVGWVWRSDDGSGAGFPIEIKVQADVDYMFDTTNPRVHEVNVVFIGQAANALITSALTGEKSFLSHWTPGVPDPSYIDLHSEHQSFYAAWWLYEEAGNTNTVLYQGNSSSNVNPGDPSVPWNKGRNADFDETVLKAYLQARGW